MKLFLVGYMGCGKTTFGKRLANKLGYNFIDLDKVIEKEIGMTIAQYFAEFGETAFREKERDLLQSTHFPSDSIIATGGGAPCFFDNMDWMNENGVTVYISLTPKSLADRLQGAIHERPVLKGLNQDELEAFITNALEKREPLYNKAKIVVEGINISPERFIPVLEEYQRK